MDIDVIAPRGSKLSTEQIEQWRIRVQDYSNHFNKKNVFMGFDLNLLRQLKQTYSDPRFFTPMWIEHLEQIEGNIIAQDRKILDKQLIRYAIYLTVASEWANRQIPYLQEQLPTNDLKYLLRESTTLDHTIIDTEYFTSESKVNHLTHLLYYKEKTGTDLSRLSTIIEFGGGYGGMTSLLRKINKDSTIIVIDAPAMIVLQIQYLSDIVGKSDYNIIKKGSYEIVKGKVNFVPISLLEALPVDLTTDLFIATWSLSEATAFTQSLIDQRKLFHATSVLFGYRYYATPNPRQPCSRPTFSMQSRSPSFHGPAFWCLDSEQYYFFI
jgi:hypothetical protein